MKWFDRLLGKEQPKNYTEEELHLFNMLGIDHTNSIQPINQTVFYTCCKLISESIGKLNFHLYQSVDGVSVKKQDLDAHYYLTIRPNPYVSPTMLITALMQNVLRYGNGYLYLEYKGYKIKGIYNLPSDRVQVLIDNKGILKQKMVYLYSDTDGKQWKIDSDNIIHIKTSDTINSLVGKSITETLAESLKGNASAENYLNRLYKQGLSARAVLHYTGDLDSKSEERLKVGVEKFANGSNNVGKILPLPVGMSLQTLDMKLADAQFLELKELNCLQIASAFGVSPTFINIYQNSSYNNSEQEMLRFLINCLQFYLVQIEDEVNYKLLSKKQVQQGYYWKINEKGILRVDAKTQAEIITLYTKNSIYTPNEARDMLDMPKLDYGDNLLANGSMITLENVEKGINYNTSSNAEGGDTNDRVQE